MRPDEEDRIIEAESEAQAELDDLYDLFGLRNDEWSDRQTILGRKLA